MVTFPVRVQFCEFIYPLLAVPGLRRFACAFCTRGCCSAAVCRLLIAAAFLVVEHRPCGRGAWAHCPVACGIFPIPGIKPRSPTLKADS